MKIRMTKKEADLLVDQLDMVLQGMSSAQSEMESDPTTFKTVEEYVETIGQAVEDFDTIYDIRKKVNNALQGRGRFRRPTSSV